MSTPASGSPGRRRRLVPGWLLLVAFVVVPLVEIYVVIQVGQVIGAWWTILLLIADSLLGSWLVKREGGRAWRALRTALQEGRMPAKELADGALILAGGLLMLTPGFVLDVLGVLLILPFTRPMGRSALARVIDRRLAPAAFAPYAGATGGVGRNGSGGRGGGPVNDDRPGPDVVRGDVVE
ncbi:hypothetical protein GCM10011519_04870 [Marmoricola endophyticus]|uniref:FxsA family protein n=1 Tax=Marmoricola endophyticus TaxID=2040280 RepID=A0A917EYK9_9ACTN|nr:FxsA family protein [Marmoricola endophyticus]GGF34425.1 hypothetical protein GCM10011519_04870 [Marmoricola endophyticus]